MALMPEQYLNKTQIIAKSKYDGKPVLAFETEQAARDFIKRAKQPPQVTWFKQTITEEEVQI